MQQRKPLAVSLTAEKVDAVLRVSYLLVVGNTDAVRSNPARSDRSALLKRVP